MTVIVENAACDSNSCTRFHLAPALEPRPMCCAHSRISLKIHICPPIRRFIFANSEFSGVSASAVVRNGCKR